MILGQDDKPALGDLTHHGVKGMKWGVRRGGNRFRGALADHNQRTTAVLTRAREGRSKGVNEKLGRGIGIAASGGKTRYNKKIDKALSDRAKQKERIDKGKLAVRDYLDALGHLTVADLVITVRDNKG